MAESFETSVSWKHVRDLCANVKLRLARSCREHGVRHPPFVSCRISQSYDTGACVYFYFAMCFRGLADPVGVCVVRCLRCARNINNIAWRPCCC